MKSNDRDVGPLQPQDHEKPFYPKYDEYEVMPGEDIGERKDRWKEFKNPYLTPEEDQFTKKKKWLQIHIKLV